VSWRRRVASWLCRVGAWLDPKGASALLALSRAPRRRRLDALASACARPRRASLAAAAAKRDVEPPHLVIVIPMEGKPRMGVVGASSFAAGERLGDWCVSAYEDLLEEALLASGRLPSEDES
jgi:hypothetical protein